MQTIIERVLTGTKMLGIFNSLNNKEFSVRSYHVDGVPEEDFNVKQPYNFIICIRHPKGTDAGKLFDKKYKMSIKQPPKSKMGIKWGVLPTCNICSKKIATQ